MSVVSRAGADSVGRSSSRRATRPPVPPGSSGRRQPADSRHTPARLRLGAAHAGGVHRLWSLSRPLTANKPTCCWRSLLDTAEPSPRRRQMITSTPHQHISHFTCHARRLHTRFNFLEDSTVYESGVKLTVRVEPTDEMIKRWQKVTGQSHHTPFNHFLKHPLVKFYHLFRVIT